MNHQASAGDHAFRQEFEACAIQPSAFNHRAHVRLAYIYLCDHDVETAYQALRQSLQAFLDHHGIDPSKYHETMTRAWMMAVRHFMMHAPEATSAARFIEQHPALLDATIMLTHYSKEALFSEKARASFVEPDLEPIPTYNR